MTSGTVYVQMFDIALANWYGEHRRACVCTRETCGTAAGAGAQRRPVLLRPLRRARATCSATSSDRHMLELVAFPAAARFGPGQARRPARVLPRLRRPLRLQRRLSKGSVHDLSRRRARTQHYLCAGYKTFFRHVDKPMQQMAALLRQNLEPDRIMRWYAARDRSHQAAITTGGDGVLPAGEA